LFKREYPLTPDEAFMASSFYSYITGDLVMRERRDRALWSSYCIFERQRRCGLDTMEVAGLVAQIIREEISTLIC
jgi:hypothetical protein